MRMYKKIIILVCFLILVFVGLSFYNNYVLKNIKIDIESGLNGEIMESNEKVKSLISEYQVNNYIEDDAYFILCNDVEKFQEFCEYRKKVNSMLEVNPFIQIENLEDYPQELEEVSHFYTTEKKTKDSRIIEKDNKYLIKYTDIKYNKNGEDIITNGNFEYTLLSREVGNKITYSQAKENHYIKLMGEGKQDGSTILIYYNSNSKEEIKISLKVIFGFIVSCERV